MAAVAAAVVATAVAAEVEEHAFAVEELQEGWGTYVAHATRACRAKSEKGVVELECGTWAEEYPVFDLLSFPVLLKLHGARLRIGVKWESHCRTSDPGIVSETGKAEWGCVTPETCDDVTMRRNRILRHRRSAEECQAASVFRL